MGNCTMKQDETTKKIEAQIKQDKKSRPIKLLLLGTGDSGKSTFARQLKVIHRIAFSPTELQRFATVVKENLLGSLQALIQHTINTGKIPKKLEKDVDKISDTATLLPEHAKLVTKLWKCDAIQNAWEDRSTLQIPSTANYFMENVDRICQSDYVPTNEDIFRAKLKTTGIFETTFEARGINFLMVDVGGQRTERRKWLHSFDEVLAVIFIAALDEFDMTLAEDNITNRMEESLKLFGEVSGSPFFKTTTWVLFLNKYDLFEKKIQTNSKALRKLFPDYNGGSDIQAGVKFIESKYREVFSGAKEQLYVYQTCALDTEKIDKLFKTLQDTVLHQSLTTTFFE
eukprot:TRINITY_DN3057_c0_g1_i1.p1 TRINITY_DN3057_c0_g1~~TRINITY_DN3057_c0_g1_i1.p1  ORF type:complete len:342 (-),score=47.48 TRINITY_DN3057_c0_g1_i1:127-1152(-)